MTGPAPTILTPTPRLARHLLRDLAGQMSSAGHAAWLAPPVYSFPAWLAELRRHYLLDSDDARTPISAEHSLQLWQSLIDREVFIGEPEVAGLAQRAWRLLHEHQLPLPHRWPDLMLSEDAERFQQWSAAYRSECERQRLLDEWSFASELPQLIGNGIVAAPAQLELAGFELPMTPLQQRILEACTAAGSRVTHRAAERYQPDHLDLRCFATGRDELHAAACWARELLAQNPQQSIAIVVPDLSGRVAAADRIFRQVFDPASYCLGESSSEAWHISLGAPLLDWPLIATALGILELSARGLSQPRAAMLLRSPYIAGFQDESVSRSETLTRLIADAPYAVTINELQWALSRAGAEVLSEACNDWQRLRGQSHNTAWPSQWTGIFQQELSALGFAAGRTLDSREYQLLQRWHELLDAFATLDLVIGSPLPRESAVALLRERARAVVFREQNPGVPVEILGIEEALGSRFDALWITTLDSDCWPGPPVRDPLIPLVLQHAIPRATGEGALALAQQQLDGLLASAPCVCGSFAEGTEETAKQPTPLFPATSVQAAPAAAATATADFAEPFADDRALAVTSDRVRGGTGVLKDQSACPFRAFALRRLGAVELRRPRPGLDAGQRGTVIHLALELFWNRMRGSAEFAATTAVELEAGITTAVAGALDRFTEKYRLTLTDSGRRLEQKRTERVVARWLDIERQRQSFTVTAQEQRIELNISGLRLSGTIDRLDELDDGATMLIDYKTGRAAKADWFPEPRINDPQLPAYAIAMQPPPAAISFARIRAEELKFDGLAAADTGTPGVTELAGTGHAYKEIDSWEALLTEWRTHLGGLAQAFLQGEAAVDPRKPAVCNHCHLHALCRIHERAPLSLLADEVDDD